MTKLFPLGPLCAHIINITMPTSGAIEPFLPNANPVKVYEVEESFAIGGRETSVLMITSTRALDIHSTVALKCPDISRA